MLKNVLSHKKSSILNFIKVSKRKWTNETTIKIPFFLNDWLENSISCMREREIIFAHSFSSHMHDEKSPEKHLLAYLFAPVEVPSNYIRLRQLFGCK